MEIIAAVADTTEISDPTTWNLIWTIIGSAFGGAILTSGVTLFTNWRDSKTEHTNWLRNEKLKTYVDTQLAFDRILGDKPFKGLSNEQKTGMLEELNVMFARIDVISPDHVLDKVSIARTAVANVESEAGKTSYKEHVKNLNTAMRLDLRIK